MSRVIFLSYLFYITFLTYNSLDIVKYLTENGADVNLQNRYRETPLHRATANSRTNTVIYLIENGANTGLHGRHNKTPLHFAVERNLGVARYIITQEIKLKGSNAQKPEYLVQHHSNFTREMSEYWDRCLDEIKELEEENEPLYDFLRESNINNLVSIWERNENVCSRFDNQESLQEQYPEYAHILINKANEVEKEIFLHNHKPLIDVLSQLGYREGNTPDRIRAFLEENRDRFKVEFGNPNRSLIDFVSFEDVKTRHVPKLKLCIVVSQIIGKNTPSRNLLNPNSEQHQAVGLLYS